MATRRAFLAAVALPALAGCTGATPAGGPTATATDTERPTALPTATDELDLREANVVEVAFDGEPGGDVRFDVTLYHDDDGEAAYANWWQVEALDGARLGRRELLHAHSTAPFTRSTTVAVPADRNCVVIRGHDQTHGYGGRAALVNLETGATRYVDQGAEPRSFSAGDCP
ncbi:MAG: hypothetical protein U5J98_08620 [Halobacteriales archaeon]|nr:hypothetical protein [Halobacteriales archaeon]